MIVTYFLYRWHKKQGEKKPAAALEEPKYLSKMPEPGEKDSNPYDGDVVYNGDVENRAGFDYAAALAVRRATQTSPPYNGETPDYVEHYPNEDAMVSRDSAMAANGPGPTVNDHNGMIPYGNSVYDPAIHRRDPSEELAIHYDGDDLAAPVPAHLHLRNMSKGTDVESLDSPIDGTSPFRLKRGDSDKKRKIVSGGSPLGRPDSTDSLDSTASSTIGSYGVPLNVATLANPIEAARADSAASNTSNESEDHEFNGLKRQDSFSRPRPSRPKTGASSIYTDGGRESRVLSWNDGSSPMPPMPALAMLQPAMHSPTMLETVVESEGDAGAIVAPSIQRNRSFSRPMRPERSASVKKAFDAVAAGKLTPPTAGIVGGIVAPPPVTQDGVSF
jgi:hypothetical protein